ncbi:hypothetical protein WICPIJ_006698 [Wickerhamomyces pijperi]|uniref:Uncharacterized protein n=1 Tax=Wickerhamomyces pijperi TaxID=599730 RepID=A0A9P8TL53_WICPI|nr:hypothetical protein WICPIJ_006698 [Wickerhamomyces pijperi]
MLCHGVGICNKSSHSGSSEEPKALMILQLSDLINLMPNLGPKLLWAWMENLKWNGKINSTKLEDEANTFLVLELRTSNDLLVKTLQSLSVVINNVIVNTDTIRENVTIRDDPDLETRGVDSFHFFSEGDQSSKTQLFTLIWVMSSFNEVFTTVDFPFVILNVVFQVFVEVIGNPGGNGHVLIVIGWHEGQVSLCVSDDQLGEPFVEVIVLWLGVDPSECVNQD